MDVVVGTDRGRPVGGVWVTHRLTRSATTSHPKAGQSVSDSTVRGGVTQVKGVTGNLRIGVPSAPTPTPEAAPAQPSPTTPTPAPLVEPQGGQSATGSQVGGEVRQVDGSAAMPRST
ncbi:hypothetical protein GCM10012278_27220 [Nonomuraea glycinis]|uniref:Uncharacterized protein n=1 Tax=Nonomuraea glycinis TaxID=2047744 RepID=A0A918A5T5_9ACTN|nr:hypothetical protein GCM10012278_27220 [Nonomuraea glycinis]